VVQYPNLTFPYGGLLELRGGSKLRLLKSAFNTENFVRRLSWSPVIWAQFTLEVCIKAWNREKNYQKPLVPLESSLALLVMISSKSVPICNLSRAIRVNSGKTTIFNGRYPSLMPSFEGNLLTQRHEIWSQKLDNLRYHAAKLILSGLGSVPGCDGQTGRNNYDS